MEEFLNYLTRDSFINFIKQPEISAALITAIVAFIIKATQPKARILWGTSHGFTFSIPQRPAGHPPQAIPNLLLSTKSIFVQNTGRAVAKNIEFHFNYKPEHLELWPSVEYETSTNPDGRFIIKVNFLSKKESLSIEAIHSFSQCPELLRLRTH